MNADALHGHADSDSGYRRTVPAAVTIPFGVCAAGDGEMPQAFLKVTFGPTPMTRDRPADFVCPACPARYRVVRVHSPPRSTHSVR
jgi:hypothetical protein